VSRFDLVIFDCDGVLVDSERLAVRTEAQILASLGWPISESEIVARFVGRSASDMHREIERHLGREVDWDGEFEVRYREVFERELVAVPGVVEALARIDTATCVASSAATTSWSSRSRSPAYRPVPGRIFSADDVERPSPRPTSSCTPRARWASRPVAARWSRTASPESPQPSRRNVGVRILRKRHQRALLSAAGAVVFDDMSELPDLLGAT